MNCFCLLAAWTFFPSPIAGVETPRCENGVCRLPRVVDAKPQPSPQTPTPIAPLPQATVEERPQQSVLIQPIPQRRALRWKLLPFRR